MSDWSNVTPADIGSIVTVLEEYSIGKPDIIRENSAAKTNRVFYVKSPKGEFVLRRAYIPRQGPLDPSQHENHLLFEAELLDYLAERGFHFTPRVIKNRRDEYLTFKNDKEFMLFTFMPGTREGMWNDLSHMNPERWQNTFNVLGKFNRSIKDFIPTHVPYERTLFDLTKDASGWMDSIEPDLQGAVRDLFLQRRSDLKMFIAETLALLEKVGYQKLPQQPVHFDYHLGNIHFKNDSVTAILDFDWARLDCRLADLATAIIFSSAYGEKNDGRLDPNLITLGINAYYDAFGPSDYTYSDEREILVAAVRARLLFDGLYTFECYRGQKGGLTDAKHALNALFVNDFDSLFA